jgi:hypothetical protein
MGFDLVVNKIYLSSQPKDWYEKHVVENPVAGQKLYIHFNYTISGEYNNIVDPFYWHIELLTKDGAKVIDYEHHVVEEDNRRAGYYYVWCLSEWVAPGGEYVLNFEVDSRNNIEESDEDNNFMSMNFTVEGEHFDLEANDIWISSKPGDIDKEHLISQPVEEGTEIYFHFQWTIWGVPDILTPPYHVKMHLKNQLYPFNELEVEGLMDKKDYRRCGYVYVGWIQDENGNGWYALPGFYTLTFIVDNENEINEWNENNNRREITLMVAGKEKEEVYPNDGGSDKDTTGVAWASAKIEILEDKPGIAYSKISSFFGYGSAYAITWLEANNLHTQKTIKRIIFRGSIDGRINNDVQFIFRAILIPLGWAKVEYEISYYIIDLLNNELVKEKKFDSSFYSGPGLIPIDEKINESAEITLLPGFYLLGIRLSTEGVSGGLAYFEIDLWDSNKGFGWSLGPINLVYG